MRRHVGDDRQPDRRQEPSRACSNQGLIRNLRPRHRRASKGEPRLMEKLNEWITDQPQERQAQRDLQEVPRRSSCRRTCAAETRVSKIEWQPRSEQSRPQTSRRTSMRLVIGSDHAGWPLKRPVIDHIRSLGHEVVDVGSHDDKPVDFPDIARALTPKVHVGRSRTRHHGVRHRRRRARSRPTR